MTEGKWLLLCQRHSKIQQAAESIAGQRLVSLSALPPLGRLKWVRAPARKKRLAANGKPNALLAPPEGGKWNSEPFRKKTSRADFVPPGWVLCL